MFEARADIETCGLFQLLPCRIRSLTRRPLSTALFVMISPFAFFYLLCGAEENGILFSMHVVHPDLNRTSTARRVPT
jgi:hypothetical protein